MDSQEEEEGAGAHDTLVPVAVDQAGEARADAKGMSDLCFIELLITLTFYISSKSNPDNLEEDVDISNKD